VSTAHYGDYFISGVLVGFDGGAMVGAVNWIVEVESNKKFPIYCICAHGVHQSLETRSQATHVHFLRREGG
jgi:hypothetical protein